MGLGIGLGPGFDYFRQYNVIKRIGIRRNGTEPHNYVNAAKGARYKIAYMKNGQLGSDCHLPNSVNSFRSFTRSSAIAVIADRTTSSILTLFIVIATSRPLNKKSVRSQSADPTITADLRPQSAVRTPLLYPQAAVQSHRSRHRVIVDKRAVPFRLVCLV